jgi:hypothetical protein
LYLAPLFDPDGVASTQVQERLAEAGALVVAEDFANPELMKLLASYSGSRNDRSRTTPTKHLNS